MVHEKPRFSQESLDVNEAKDWNFFFHSTADNNVLAIVINLLDAWLAHQFITNHLILSKAIILIENSHLKGHNLLKVLLICGVEFIDGQFRLLIIIFVIFFFSLLDVVNNIFFDSTCPWHHALFLVISAHKTLQQMLTLIFSPVALQKLIQMALTIVHVYLIFIN